MKPVIVGVAGLQVAPDEAALLRQHHPAGAILFARNIGTPGQVAALTLELARLLPPLASIMIDQEGGRVARLRPPHWLQHPPAAAYGTLFATNPPAAIRAAWLSGALIGLEAAAAGIDVVTAPVLDRAVPGADAIIGNRAFRCRCHHRGRTRRRLCRRHAGGPGCSRWASTRRVTAGPPSTATPPCRQVDAVQSRR